MRVVSLGALDRASLKALGKGPFIVIAATVEEVRKAAPLLLAQAVELRPVYRSTEPEGAAREPGR